MRKSTNSLAPLFLAAAVLQPVKTTDSLLLSDLATPCFVIDTQALRRVALSPTVSNDGSSRFMPSIRLPASGRIFHPKPIISYDTDIEHASDVLDVTFPIEDGQPAIGFLHTSVTRAREEATSQDSPINTFLAEIDLDPSLCGDCKDELGQSAKLVLGLNNHHVGSYYWARSAGAGASMEAPGVLFGCSASDDGKGTLRWIDEGGPVVCNSNDGKRSEWVNFLRKCDTVQLVPVNGQKAMMRISEKFDTECRLFGVSAEGRPMGSEPRAVCEWRHASI